MASTGAEGVEPERADALLVGVGVFRDPLGRLPAHGLLGDQAAASRTGPRDAALQASDLLAAHALGLGLEVDGVEHDLAVLPTLGAAVAPALLRALVEAGLDVAGALDGRSGDLDGLGVVEGRLPGLGQRPRVALGAGARGPAVTLVADDVAAGVDASAEALLEPVSVSIPPGKDFWRMVLPLSLALTSCTFAFSGLLSRIIGATRSRLNFRASSMVG